MSPKPQTPVLIVGAGPVGLALAGAQLGDLEMDLTTKDIRGSPRLNQIFGYEAIPLAWGYETFLQHVHPEDLGLR